MCRESNRLDRCWYGSVDFFDMVHDQIWVLFCDDVGFWYVSILRSESGFDMNLVTFDINFFFDINLLSRLESWFQCGPWFWFRYGSWCCFQYESWLIFDMSPDSFSKWIIDFDFDMSLGFLWVMIFDMGLDWFFIWVLMFYMSLDFWYESWFFIWVLIFNMGFDFDFDMGPDWFSDVFLICFIVSNWFALIDDRLDGIENW